MREPDEKKTEEPVEAPVAEAAATEVAKPKRAVKPKKKAAKKKVAPKKKPKRRPVAKKKRVASKKRPAKKKRVKIHRTPNPQGVPASNLSRLRKILGLSHEEFGRANLVTMSSSYRWEANPKESVYGFPAALCEYVLSRVKGKKWGRKRSALAGRVLADKMKSSQIAAIRWLLNELDR